MCDISVCHSDHILSNVIPYIFVGNLYATYKYTVYLRGVDII